MASGLDTTKVRKAFHRAAKDPAVAVIAVAVYQKPLRDGLRARLNSGNWAPNSPGWLAAKRRKGWGRQPLVRTGKLLKAISNNPPNKLGTRKGIKVGVNWRNAVAFMLPRVFTDGRGKRLPPKQQEMVFNTHRYGGAIAKIRSGWRASAGRRLKKGLRLQTWGTYLSGAAGPTRRQRERSMHGQDGIPARPLFAWSREWTGEMNEDVEEAVRRVLAKEGFDVRH